MHVSIENGQDIRPRVVKYKDSYWIDFSGAGCASVSLHDFSEGSLKRFIEALHRSACEAMTAPASKPAPFVGEADPAFREDVNMSVSDHALEAQEARG